MTDFDSRPHDEWARARKRQQAERRGLRLLAIVCLAILTVVLVADHVADSEQGIVPISATAPASATAYVNHCHSSPDALAWCRWIEWMQTPGAAAYFAWATAPKPALRLGDPALDATWYTLRECEAPDWAGGWSANTGNGYYGGLQFGLSSWRWVGGSGYPHQASVAEQIYRGRRLHALQGWGAWPTCSRKLGWR